MACFFNNFPEKIILFPIKKTVLTKEKSKEKLS